MCVFIYVYIYAYNYIHEELAWLCNGLPHNDPKFESLWGWCKHRASRPSQGTVNDLAVDGTLNTTNQPNNIHT